MFSQTNVTQREQGTFTYKDMFWIVHGFVFLKFCYWFPFHFINNDALWRTESYTVILQVGKCIACEYRVMDEYDKGYSRHSFYNIAHGLALYKSHWAAMTKIFIYARPCVNKMKWAFFFPSFRVSVLLSCSAVFVLLEIWKKPAKNFPVFLSALTF